MFEHLGREVTLKLHTVGSFILFGKEVVRKGLSVRLEKKHFIDECFQIGVGALGVIVFASLFVGAILALQIHLQLVDYGATSFLGGLTASVSLRNVGPVLIAFVLAAKVGAYTAAELSVMRVTDQIEALRCLGRDPLAFLIWPRLLAVFFSSVCLLLLGLMISFLGGMVFSELSLKISPAQFSQKLEWMITWPSVLLSLAKAFVLGTWIAWVSCYHGYFAAGGARGVGWAVRQSAVQCTVGIIIINFVMSMLMNIFIGFFHAAD